MDLGQFIFPFIMAVITNSVMIIAIYFLRKIPYFSNLFSVWFMVVLYLVCVLRMFLPLEFPDVQIILRDTFLYRFLINGIVERAQDSYVTSGIALYIILGIWLAGFVVFGVVSLVTHRTKKTYYLANYDFTTDEERTLFDRISREILCDSKRITLKKTDAVKSIMVIGYFHHYVLLPVKEYAPDELEMIFRHECIHIRNKDLWLKLLVHIYCCIFWWNPLSYLLKHDLSFTLEMRCDLSATKDFSDEQKRSYFDALKANCRQKSKQDKDEHNYFFLCAEFTDERRKNRANKEFVKRTKAIAKDPPNKVGQIAANTAVSLLLVSLFVASYFFIWQPFYGYDADDNLYDLNEGATIVDDTNSYLVLQEDGNYLLYYENFPPIPVTKEEYEEGLFIGYPVLEN